MKIAWIETTTSETDEAKKHYDDTKKIILGMTVGEARLKAKIYTNLELCYESLNFCGDVLNKALDKEFDL